PQRSGQPRGARRQAHRPGEGRRRHLREGEPVLSLRQCLLALRARGKPFALVLVATVLATALVSLVIPKTYVANTAIVVDKRDEQFLTSDAARHPREQAGYLQTQVDILTSQKVARK